MKEYSGKRIKTEADYIALSRLEWIGGLYTTEPITISKDGTVSGGGRVCIPGKNIEAMLAAAATAMKKGKQFKAGCLVDESPVLEYTGPKAIADMIGRPQFTDKQGCKLNGKVTVIRTRPIFRDWSLTVNVQFLPSLLNVREVSETLERAGQIVGLGDFKPRYGRFNVEIL